MDYTLRDWKGGQAGELADWWAIAHDLDHVRNSLRLLMKFSADSKEEIIQRALWTSALIAYARCFGTGRDTRLRSEEVYKALPGPAMQEHEVLIATRSKHIAHSVNEFEQTKVGPLVGEDGTLKGTGHIYGFKISDSAEGLQRFDALAATAAQFVASRISPLEDQLLKEAETFSREKLLALPEAQIEPKVSKAGLVRQRQ